MEHIIATNEDCVPYAFTAADINAIEKIRDEKYATNEWNYGQSPDYSFRKEIKTNGGMLEMNLDVEKGIIQKAKIFVDFFNEKDITEIEKALENKAHDELVLRELLSKFTIDAYFKGMTADDLLSALF